MAQRLDKKPLPKLRDAERSRQKILLTAEELFAHHGPGVSVDDIAKASGLNKRMVYHYFQNKKGLWRQVLVRQYEKVAAVEVSLPKNVPTAQIVSELVSRYYRFLARDENFVKILMYENLQEGQAVAKIPIAKTKAPVLQALEQALKSTNQTHLDPAQLLIDCLALCFFYFSNRATLSVLLDRDLSEPETIERRIGHLRQVISRIV